MKIEKYWSIAPFHVFSVKMGSWILIDFYFKNKTLNKIQAKYHFLAQQ